MAYKWLRLAVYGAASIRHTQAYLVANGFLTLPSFSLWCGRVAVSASVGERVQLR